MPARRSIDPARLLALAAALGWCAHASALDLDDLEPRLSVEDRPGLDAIARTRSSTTAGAPDPAGNGTITGHARRGYAIEAGMLATVPLSEESPWCVVGGLGVRDGENGMDLAGTAGPGGTVVNREDLDAFAVALHAGVAWRAGSWRLSIVPFLDIGVARAVYSAPSASTSSSSFSALFAGSSTEVRSGAGLYTAEGVAFECAYAPVDPGSMVLALGVGYEAMDARVAITPNATTGGASDHLSGHGLVAAATIGSRF
jgi:hypothetical protein